MPRIPQYTTQQVVDAVKSSSSIRQVLIQLNLAPQGGNYATIHKLISKLKLDTSHFLGQGIHKGQILGPRRPIEDYLSNKHSIQSYKLKKRLIKEGFFVHKCNNCNHTKWLGNLIPLELDHLNGNHNDNTLSNLRLLCPNCHALTPNYRGKNISRKAELGVATVYTRGFSEFDIIHKGVSNPSAQIV